MLSIGFVAASYPGQGKREVSSDRLLERAVRWEELSEKVDEAELDFGKFDRLIGDDHHKEGGMDNKQMALRHPIPLGSGWWPACIINWTTQHTDHGYESHTAYFTAVVNGVATVYCICWYQLHDGTNIITAWPVFLTSRL